MHVQEVTEPGIAELPPIKPKKATLDRRADVHTVHRAARLGWGGDKEGGPGKLDRRSEQHTVRAGTRGFRAPEVLMRCAVQTPAIDVWSAGVVMLSVLSGTSPFFISNRDVDGLAEIAAIFGHRRVSALATFYGKTVRFIFIFAFLVCGITIVQTDHHLNPSSVFFVRLLTG